VEETCPYSGSLHSLIQHCVTSRNSFSGSKIRHILCPEYLHVCLVVSHSLSHSTLTLTNEYSISISFVTVFDPPIMESGGIRTAAAAWSLHSSMVSVHLFYAWKL
jgi:hypothetical protein